MMNQTHRIWWSVIAEAGPQTMFSPPNMTRADLSKANFDVPDFQVLYGPVSKEEAEQFLDDTYPTWRKDRFTNRGLGWLLDYWDL